MGTQSRSVRARQRYPAQGAVPRGGSSPGRIDQAYFTDRVEYYDRSDVSAITRARVLIGLDRFHRVSLAYRFLVSRIRQEVANIDSPRILELGAGHGELSRRVISAIPAAQVCVSDIDPSLVGLMSDTAVGQTPGVSVQQIDAGDIAADEGTWDLAVFVFGFHHLDTDGAVSIIREGTRVARVLLIVDAWRHPVLLAASPLLLGLGGWALFHDGVISLRRMYGPDGYRALAQLAGEATEVDCSFLPPAFCAARFVRLDEPRNHPGSSWSAQSHISGT